MQSPRQLEGWPANGALPFSLPDAGDGTAVRQLHRLRRDAATEAGGLLCVLFLRLSAVSADTGRAVG